MNFKPVSINTNSPLKRPIVRLLRDGSSVFSIKYGKHRADNLTLNEAAINQQVLRVHLERQISNKTTGLRKRKATSLHKLALIKKNTSASLSSDINQNLKKVVVELKENKGLRDPKSRNKLKSSSKMSTVLENHDNRNVKPIVKNLKETQSMNSDTFKTIRSINQKLVSNQLNKDTVLSEFKYNSVPVTKMSSMIKRKSVQYYLKFQPEKPYYENRKLNYKFSKLAVDVRSLRLPAPFWKIKIFMRNKAISAIAFTNKQPQERVLKFCAANNMYEIIIDNKKAELLGSPLTVDSRSDVEVLLDIIHNIKPDNPMIRYK